MGQQISDADLREELRRVAEELGERPTVRQFNEYSEHSEATVRDRFGSWSDALAAAGLETAGSKRPIPRPELLEELRDLAAELGHRPTAEEMNTQGPRWATVYQRRFGSWNDALTEAGFEPRTSRGAEVSISRKELQTELQSLADKVGRSPQVDDMVKEGAFAVGRYRDEFGSWAAALEAAGIDTDSIPERLPTERLLTDLKQVATNVDAPPTTKEFDAHSEYAASTVIRRFGSWDDALEAAGLDSEMPRGSRANDDPSQALQIPDEELLSSIRELAAGSDPPTLQEYRDDGTYGAQTLYDRFGSWNNAVEAAGFDTRDPESKVPKGDLVSELKRLSVDGDPPSAADMRQNGEYWVSTYRDRFGSWNDALNAAGFDPSDKRAATEPNRTELLEALQELATEHGERPTQTVVTSDSEYSVYAYKTKFGSWSNALEAAGFDPSSNSRIPEDELLSEIRRLADELNERPTAREMDADGCYASATYQSRFGAWSTAVEKALEAAGDAE